MAYEICHTVGITHLDMEPSVQENVAQDHFLQILSDTECGRQLNMWRPFTMSEAVDAAARYAALGP